VNGGLLDEATIKKNKSITKKAKIMADSSCGYGAIIKREEKRGGRGERRKGAKEERERGPISYKYWCATWWVTFPTYL
jgi:hypothetical protein